MTPAIALLVRVYPKISETFILEEILGLEQRGLALTILSLYRPHEPVTHPATGAVRAQVSYVVGPDGRGEGRLVACHARLLLTRPLRYIAALWFAMRRSEAGRRRDFHNGAWLGAQMIRAGLRHVHAHFASEPAAVAEIAARLTGCTFSVSAHAKDIYTGRPEPLRRKLSAARFTVTCTESNRRHLTALTGGGSVHRCHHGIDTARFSVAGRRTRDTPPLVLSVGRLRPKKGFETLIEACRLLRAGGVEFACEIVGYGEERAKLSGRIALAGLDGVVRLSGILAQDAVIARYARASLFVLPCRIAADGDRDGIPNVLMEAMAMQVPVVSTTVSGIPELIEHGESGLLCPPDDPAALADAMQTLLADPVLAERLGARGRATVTERFGRDRNVAGLHRLLLAAAGSDESAPDAGSLGTAGVATLGGAVRRG